MVQRFDQTEQLQIGSTSTGASGGLMALSQRFDQLRQQAMQIAETEVVQTATREGMEAFKPGEKPEFKDEEVFFGRTGAKAFNQGLRTQYLASLSNDIRKDLAAIQTENPNDVQAFTEQAGAVRAALQQEVDPSVLPQVLSQFDQYATNSQITVAKNQFETKRQESISQTNEAINNIGADAARLARSGDMVAAQQSLQEVRTHLDNAVEAGFMTQAESNESFKSLQREAIEQENKGKFDTLAETEGFEAAFEKLDEISSKVPKGWTPDQWDTVVSSVRTNLNRKQSRAKAAKTEVLQKTEEDLKNYSSAVSLGFEVDPAETARIQKAVQGTELQAQFDRVNKVSAFSVMSYSDRDQILNNAQTGQLSDVQDYAALVKAQQGVNKLAREDAYSLGVNQGIVDKVPFDMDDPASFAARVEQSKILSDHYGVSASPLTNAEAEAISNSIDEMTPAEKTQLATTFSQSPSIWGQIAEKNQSEFAMIGATGDQQLMTVAFKGKDLIKNGLIKPATLRDYYNITDEYLGQVYGPQDKKAVIDASTSVYAAMGGLPGDEFDEDLYEEALAQVTGGVSEVNGFRVQLPRGTDPDDFEDFIDDFTSEAVAFLGGVSGFTNEEAAEAIQDGKITSIGEGKYIVMGDNNSALFGVDGNPFVIEYTDELYSLVTATNSAQRKQAAMKVRGQR